VQIIASLLKGFFEVIGLLETLKSSWFAYLPLI
jgi:hypothetical protein